MSDDSSDDDVPLAELKRRKQVAVGVVATVFGNSRERRREA